MTDAEVRELIDLLTPSKQHGIGCTAASVGGMISLCEDYLRLKARFTPQLRATEAFDNIVDVRRLMTNYDCGRWLMRKLKIPHWAMARLSDENCERVIQACEEMVKNRDEIYSRNNSHA